MANESGRSTQIEDVLCEMDEATREFAPAFTSKLTIQHWLEVLRPFIGQALARNLNTIMNAVETSPSSNLGTEIFPLRSSLEQRLLRDLSIMVKLTVDHEGGGSVQIEYEQTPPEHRLQALNSLQGVLGTRIMLDIGRQAYVDLLRGVADRYERELRQ